MACHISNRPRSSLEGDPVKTPPLAGSSYTGWLRARRVLEGMGRGLQAGTQAPGLLVLKSGRVVTQASCLHRRALYESSLEATRRQLIRALGPACGPSAPRSGRQGKPGERTSRLQRPGRRRIFSLLAGFSCGAYSFVRPEPGSYLCTTLHMNRARRAQVLPSVEHHWLPERLCRQMAACSSAQHV